jgi:hypothetical protein
MNQNVIDNETQEKLDAFIKQEEGDSNDYKGLLAKFITLVAVGMSLFHLLCCRHRICFGVRAKDRLTNTICC